MSSNVTRLPVKRRLRMSATPQEIWSQPAPPDDMVWSMCAHRRSEPCQGCPAFEEDDGSGGLPCAGFTRGCYGLAQEACRLVFALQAKVKPDAD